MANDSASWPVATWADWCHMARVLELDLAIAYLKDDVDLMRDIEARASEWGVEVRR